MGSAPGQEHPGLSASFIGCCVSKEESVRLRHRRNGRMDAPAERAASIPPTIPSTGDGNVRRHPETRAQFPSHGSAADAPPQREMSLKPESISLPRANPLWYRFHGWNRKRGTPL